MIAILIDSNNQVIRQVEYKNSDDIRKLIGGWIELAHKWEHGDSLLIDEDGLLKRPEHFFRIQCHPTHIIPGNGLILGKQLKTGYNLYPVLTVDQVRAIVEFQTWSRKK
jgi:hypothetical protein